jgi:hypothetical protein
MSEIKPKATVMAAEASSTPVDAEPTEIPLIALEQGAHALMAWFPADVLERLARYTQPWAIKARRLAERDETVRRLAASHYLELPSGRAIAKEMRRALSIYAGGAESRHEEQPADPRRASMHRILRLSKRKTPSEITLRRALAGLETR